MHDGNDQSPGDPPDAMAFGRAIPPGLGINLLVRSVADAVAFQTTVLGARADYVEEHFAVLCAVGSRWLLHADWSYRRHALRGAVEGVLARGAGVELRLYGLDPDAAEARARRAGATVLDGATDREHGLREAYLVDPDGYVWVPCVPLAVRA
jgi:catechol 2,3-dioxygenase-like lactoylglutathione lyase family enzyme